MKKFLTLVLALAMVLALTVPAMAFTSVTPSDDSPYELDIYLVEHEDDSFFGLVGLPPSDRGYAKNEIVAAVVELVVPKDEALGDDFASLVLSGENVSLKVVENEVSGLTAKLYTSAGPDKPFDYDPDDDELSTDALASYDTSSSKKTVKVLFFAKVTGDDASLTATLNADDSSFGTLSASYSSLTNALVVGDYVVKHTSDSFLVYDKDSFDTDAVKLFEITVDKDNKTEDLFIYGEDINNTKYLAVNPEGGVFYTTSGTRVSSSSIIRDLQAVYEDAFVEDFGFDFSISGGVLKESFFTGINGSDDVEATVEIKPWTAYVTVPDNIVVDPPKTGDAASIVGFVMIVLAAAAVVAVKKVRA